MRICFISFEYPPNIIGGLGVYADQLVRCLREEGIDVVTITRGERTGYCDGVLRIPTPNVLYWQRLFFINRAIAFFHVLNAARKFDLVHLNGAYPIARGLGLPTVCTFHSCNFPQFIASLKQIRRLKTLEDISALILRMPIGFLADIESVHFSQKIICPSPSIKRELQTCCFASEESLQVVPNGIDLNALDELDSSDTTLLGKYGIEKNNFVLFVGRLISLKGVDILIRAFKIARKTCMSIKLVIAGSGPCASYLKSLAHGEDDIIFIGQVNSKVTKKLLYESCLAVVVPSHHETLPTVIMEAMACKKPVIATNVGGNPFMIEHGKNGFIVEPGDTKGIANYITLLYENSSLVKHMGSINRKLVEEKFTIEKTVNETKKVYESLCNRSKK